MIPSFTPVIFTSDRGSLQLQTSAGRVVGKLEPRHSKILQVLRDDDDVELQAYVVSPLPQEPPRGQAKKSFKKLMPALSVILYGPMKVFEAIAEFWSSVQSFFNLPCTVIATFPTEIPKVSPQKITILR